MMKRITGLLILLSVSVSMSAQQAEILSHHAVVSVNSPVDVRYTVTERIRINDKRAEELACFVYYTDAFRSISSFSGTIETGGKVIKRIKQSDLYTVQDSKEFADDTYLNVYSPEAGCPYEVEYKYTISFHKAIASFPAFMPVSAADTPVREASYTILVPPDYRIQYKSSFEPVVGQEKDKMSYSWKIQDYKGLVLEDHMPPLLETVPYAFASPVDFRYSGTGGCQSSWKEAGEWLNSIMPKDFMLPPELAAKVHQLTDGCRSDLEKLRKLYEWLGEYTRYVSIQFGIGGYSPMPPSRVYKTGYGDCKALSFLLKQMLSEIQIHSEYFIINTDRKKLYDNYSVIGQMNHAMLCVPLQSDTVWVECTNAKIPLGYRHSDAAGHQVVLITGQGGKETTIPDYPDSLKTDTDYARIEVTPDGKASIRARRIRRLAEAEPYISFNSLDAKKKNAVLSRYMKCHPNALSIDAFKDNFLDYDGTPGYIPEVEVEFSFTSDNFAKLSGNRIFVPVNIYNIGMKTQRSARVHDLVFNGGGTDRYEYEIVLPEGYAIEVLPESKSISHPSCDCTVSYSQEGNSVFVTFNSLCRPCRLPASSYGEYASFAKAFNKAADATIVLIKKEQ